MGKLRFEIGLDDEDVQSLPIVVDEIARAVLNLIPKDYRVSTLRTINNAADRLTAVSHDYGDMTIVRVHADEGHRFAVGMTMQDPDEGDETQTLLLYGFGRGPGYHMRGGILRLEDVPTSIIARDLAGTRARDLVDTELLEGIQIDRSTTATSSGKTSLEAIFSGSRIPTEDFLQEWLVD